MLRKKRISLYALPVLLCACCSVCFFLQTVARLIQVMGEILPGNLNDTAIVI